MKSQNHNLSDPSKQNKKAHRIINIAATLPNMNKGKIKSDVQGSYTGIGTDGSYPVQDADDL